MKSMKSILAEFREYSEKVNSLERMIEGRKATKKRLDEDRELFNEISRESAERIYDWMRDTDGMPYDFESLFDGAMRTYIPLASEEQRKMAKIVRALKSSGWSLPELQGTYGPYSGFETKKVKQKLQRLQADGGGEYEIEVDVADLRLVKKTQKVIPAGPRAGETVEKKENTTMSKAIARLVKGGQLGEEHMKWWQSKQVMYTRDANHKTIEKSFAGEDGSLYSIVLSRHPIDVLRMSDISNIRSCHSEGSEYFHCALAEAKGHGPIAYLVKTEDLENHLMDKPEDLDPTQILGRAMNSLDRDEYREKMAKEFDLESPAGRWVYIETWAETVDGDKWLKGLQQRIDMASAPEKFEKQFMNSKAKQLGVPAEELKFYYRTWQREEIDIRPIKVKKAEYEKAREAVYDRKSKPNQLKPLSDFDNQELFRDRQRSVQGIGATARLRMRKFEEPMRYGTFAVPEKRTYGASVPGFVNAVTKWAADGQRDQFLRDDDDDAGQYIGHPRIQDLTRRGGSYADNQDGEILNDFFLQMSGEDKDSYEEPYGFADEAHTDEDDEDNNEMEEMWNEYERRVDELNNYADNTLERAYAQATVEDYGDEGRPYVSADGGIRYDIELPWADWAEDEDGDYVELDKKDGEPVVDEEGNVSHFIPKVWGGDYERRSAFTSAIDDPLDYYPEETEWEIAQGPDGRPSLQIMHRLRMEDGDQDPDDYEGFIDYLASDIDRNYRENREKIRKSLVEGGWFGPNDWDHLQDDISEMAETLKNWSVFGVGDDDGEVVFRLKPDGKGRSHMKTGIKWPYPSSSDLTSTAAMKGLFGGERATFGVESYLRFRAGETSRGATLFTNAFRGLQDAANEYAKRQLSLNFGSEYEEKYEPIEMGKNVELGVSLVTPEDAFDAGGKATFDGPNSEEVALGFLMTIRVFSEDRTDEIESTFNFVKYIDNNMEALRKAVISAFNDEILTWEDQRKADERAMTDGTAMQRHAKMLTLQWDDAAHDGNQAAESYMLVVMWVQQNFDRMETSAEKWVATDKLRAMNQPGRAFNEWDTTAEMPINWDNKVKEKLVALGATWNQKEAYSSAYLKSLPPATTSPSAPSDAGAEQEQEKAIDAERESWADAMNDDDDENAGPIVRNARGQRMTEAELKQEVYKRLQKKILKKKVKLHLTEKISQQKELQRQRVRTLVKSKLSAQGLMELDLGYTQRTYKITFRIAMSKDHGGLRAETENEMRAVPGVGTVKIVVGTTRQDGSNYYADALIKFHLLGKRSVIQYIRSELLPALRNIEGLSVMRMDRYEEITTMREWSDAYSGHGVSPNQGRERAVPTPTIDAIAQDWINVGKDGMGIAASSLAHSVGEVTMIPVIELMRYLGTNYFSATTKEFETVKQQIINQGIQGPIMVAIGKNGRVRITAGNDLVLAAKDIGIEEVPVTFSLQLQV